MRKVWEHSGLVHERIYLGGYEIWREHTGSISSPPSPDEERETLHISDDARRVCMVETLTVTGGSPVGSPTPRFRYRYDNHLGTACVEADTSGAVISYEEYHPYGTSSYRSFQSSEVSAKRYRYTGKERDEETSLYYHGARYYAPWLGRWMSADPAGTVDGTNLYAYVRGSPIGLVDPNGMQGHHGATVSEFREEPTVTLTPQVTVKLPPRAPPPEGDQLELVVGKAGAEDVRAGAPLPKGPIKVGDRPVSGLAPGPTPEDMAKVAAENPVPPALERQRRAEFQAEEAEQQRAEAQAELVEGLELATSTPGAAEGMAVAAAFGMTSTKELKIAAGVGAYAGAVAMMAGGGRSSGNRPGSVPPPSKPRGGGGGPPGGSGGRAPSRLVVGAGAKSSNRPPGAVRPGDVTLDINPKVQPDIVADIRKPVKLQGRRFDEVTFERVPHFALTPQAMTNAAKALQPGGRVEILTGKGAPTAELSRSMAAAGFTNVQVDTVVIRGVDVVRIRGIR